MRALVIVAGTLAALPTVAYSQDADAVAEAGRAFGARCIRCHQPPDVNLATDRAWLDQVKRTN